MEDLMLVKKIDPNDKSEDLYVVSFGISNIRNDETVNLINKTLENIEYVDRDSVVFRYNGIELRLAIKNIPDAIRAFVEEGIDLYSVYIRYESLY